MRTDSISLNNSQLLRHVMYTLPDVRISKQKFSQSSVHNALNNRYFASAATYHDRYRATANAVIQSAR
jgi:hypothetical protein